MMRFVYFDGVSSYTDEEMRVAYGYTESAFKVLKDKGAFAAYKDRFEKTFLANIVPGETYIFVIVSPAGDNFSKTNFHSYQKFQRYLKDFAMEPYMCFQSPTVFMNRNVDKHVPRLRLYAFKFDEKYVEFAKGFVK